MSNDEGQIEDLKKKLFSNSGEELPAQRRIRLHKNKVTVGEAWEEDPAENKPAVKIPEVEYSHRQKFGSTVYQKILIFSVLVLIIAMGFAWYAFSTGINDISSGNIDVRLLGPVSSPSGEELSLDVDITNNNNADLLLADLVITYPQGTRSAIDKSSSMLTDRLSLGTIKANGTVRETVKSILFGEENDHKDVQISLEYRLQGSDSIFTKNKVYPLYIGSAPISVSIDSVKEVIPEQENDFDITIRSNSASIIKNIVMRADYPFGFDLMSSIPNTSAGNNIWILGDILPQEERHIKIHGRLLGGANEDRVFHFYTGTADPSDASSVGTIFATNAVPIALKRPFLGLDLALDGQSAETFVAQAGTPVKAEITFQNNLTVPLRDVVIQAKISGDMLNKSEVVGDNSFYSSSNNTIMWDNSTLADLKELTPRDSGRTQFMFSTLEPSDSNNSIFRRQSITLDITVRAKRLNENNVPEEIVSTVSRTIKVTSDLTLDDRMVRTIGPFQNTGPFPPMPEKPSTYTMLISVGNSYNTVKNAVFTATLPSYVTWLGATYPNSNGVSYNADTRQVTWVLGDIAAGTGFASSPKEVAFQVSFLPSISQTATTPILINEQKVSGTDTFTGKVIQVTNDALTTKIERDPAYVFGKDKVGGQ